MTIEEKKRENLKKGNCFWRMKLEADEQTDSTINLLIIIS